ncbi:class I SAM-dependent methyltransferase [Chitinophaga lutea]|uniref:Class I SAM-dependent methyltransferase n=1 Tax=Chitinophaga lutea TaxID=2488634 RepID=A0A3N4PUT1_9BACT|nr:class I SAM-dependent methyltransferase [Chitinophaga lutea]RPE07917.1 class I SAM-dependent methyltransferase [Chitinophaga lutea]
MTPYCEGWDSLSVDRDRLEKVAHHFLAPISGKLIEPLVNLSEGYILDVATGTGEPGITLAETNPLLQVVGLDLSARMLTVAGKNAVRRNVPNYSVCQSDAGETPFEDERFHAIICRNGIMFFPDLAKALREMHRLLKPGGSIHLCTWGQLSKNLWLDIVLTQVSAVTQAKVYRTFTPGMFYCMQPGFTTEWLDISGFRSITEQELTGIVSFNSMEEYWDYVTTVSSAIVEALRNLPPTSREQVKRLVFDRLSTHIVNGRLYFQWTSNITTAFK